MSSERVETGAGLYDFSLLYQGTPYGDVMIAHQHSIDRLRSVGIAQMIEELAMTRIPQLTLTDESGTVHPRFPLGSGRENEWSLSATPEINPNETIDPILRIRGLKSFYDKQITRHSHSRTIHSCEFAFTEDTGQFTVSGNEITFSGSVIEPTADVLIEVRVGITQALDNPKITPSRYARAHLQSNH